MWQICFIVKEPRLNFYSHIPCGMWLYRYFTFSFFVEFLLTHPVWDVTNSRSYQRKILWFLLTHPVWDVTSLFYVCLTQLKFLLTHPVWDVTFIIWGKWFMVIISTHTSRVGCDPATAQKEETAEISTHTSRVGCDATALNHLSRRVKFLLTHPVWDVTDYLQMLLDTEKNFYSHIPCGMWLSMMSLVLFALLISTNTSRVGCD